MDVALTIGVAIALLAIGASLPILFYVGGRFWEKGKIDAQAEAKGLKRP